MRSTFSLRTPGPVRTLVLLAAAVVVAALAAAPAARSATVEHAPPLRPIDPQHWQDQQDMTWDDYHPIPGLDWARSGKQPAQRALRVALGPTSTG
jgi:hypothetical protein